MSTSSVSLRDGGQSTVEFALVLPVLVVMAAVLVVVGVAVRNELAVEHAAREGVRAAAVAADPDAAARAAATRVTTLPIEVSTLDDGITVTVTVTTADELGLPIVGSLFGPITHTATATMMLEPVMLEPP
jgi:Flp pilus assembly protein TadG